MTRTTHQVIIELKRWAVNRERCNGRRTSGKALDNDLLRDAVTHLEDLMEIAREQYTTKDIIGIHGEMCAKCEIGKQYADEKTDE